MKKTKKQRITKSVVITQKMNKQFNKIIQNVLKTKMYPFNYEKHVLDNFIKKNNTSQKKTIKKR